MKQKQKIIQMYLEDVSKRKKAKKINVSRNRVDKYILEFEKSGNEDVRDLPITEDIMKSPTYKKRRGRKKVLTGEIIKILRGYIESNTWKRNHYMHKQQMKMIDMHEKLIDKGYSIGYTTVRNFVNRSEERRVGKE